MRIRAHLGATSVSWRASRPLPQPHPVPSSLTGDPHPQRLPPTPSPDLGPFRVSTSPVWGWLSASSQTVPREPNPWILTPLPKPPPPACSSSQASPLPTAGGSPPYRQPRSGHPSSILAGPPKGMTPDSRLSPRPSSPGGQPSTLPSHSGPAGFGLWSTGMRLCSLPLCLPRPLHCPTSRPRRQNNRQLNVQEVSRGLLASEFPWSSMAPRAFVWSVTAPLASYRCDSRDSEEWSLTQAKREASEKPGPNLHFASCTNNSCRTPETSGGAPSPQSLSMETQKGLQSVSLHHVTW